MAKVSTEMKSASLKSAFKAGIVRNISEVRMNSSDYLFVTLLGMNGKATNLYLGKKSAEQVEEDDVLTSEQLMNAEIVLATNEDDEQRLKLSLTGESSYTNLSSIFGDAEVSNSEKEVLNALRADMTSREETEEEDEDEDDDAEAIAEAKLVAEARAERAKRKLAKK